MAGPTRTSATWSTREECLVIEGSHEPLIDRETRDIVQRVRRNKRRLTKMEEQNK